MYVLLAASVTPDARPAPATYPIPPPTIVPARAPLGPRKAPTFAPRAAPFLAPATPPRTLVPLAKAASPTLPPDCLTLWNSAAASAPVPTTDATPKSLLLPVLTALFTPVGILEPVRRPASEVTLGP